MAERVGVRDYLGSLVGSGNVGYDENTKGVTVTSNGKTYNLGNAGMTLGDDNKYYTDNPEYLKSLLIKQTGYVPVRNTVQAQGGTVGWADNQVIINGQNYSTDGMINTNGTLYADPNFLNKLSTKYENPYTAQQEKIFDKVYKSRFSYNPETDTGLQAAQKQAQNSVTRDAASRGILNSTDATYYSGLATSQLVPQYEQMAYSRYQDENQRLMNLSTMLSNMNSQDIQVWQANNTEKYNNTMLTLQKEQQAQQKQQNDIENAYNKVEMLSYADNESAVILGVKPGTPATSVRQATQEKLNQIELMIAQTNENIRATEYDYNLKNSVVKTVTSAKNSSGGGYSGSGYSGGGTPTGGDAVATAIQEYAINNGLGSYIDMTADEIVNVIDSKVSDPALRQQYYAQYNITEVPQNTTTNISYRYCFFLMLPINGNTYADKNYFYKIYGRKT